MSTNEQRKDADSFRHGIARAFAGAILFSLPLLMTEEMWHLGATIRPGRLSVFILLMIPLFIALDHMSGFRRNETWTEDALDGLVGYGVGILAAGAGLLAFHILPTSDPFTDIAGRVLLEAVPAGYGAVLANSQFAAVQDDGAANETDEPASEAPYPRELFLMLAGALFFSLQLAPTREMGMIGSAITEWHALVLMTASIVLIHIFVYRINFRGQHEASAPGWHLLIRYSMVGYAIAAIISGYVLWTLGQLDGLGTVAGIRTIVVLAFPASLGAAAARLLV